MAPELTQQLNTMYTAQFQLRSSKIWNQVTTATPFFYLMSKNGRIKFETGGRFIEEPIEYDENGSLQWIGRGQSVEIQETDPLTTSYWNWKYLTGHIVRRFVDFQQNRGKGKVIDKVNADIDNLKNKTISVLEEALFSDGTGSDGKAMDGLGNIVASAPTTGTVGGINRASYSWWRNNTTSMSGEAVTDYLIKRMRTMFNDCGQLSGTVDRFPDLIITTQTNHEHVESETLEIARIRIGDKGMADLGFGDLAFKGRPIVWSPSCPSGLMYFLNTASMKVVVDKIKWLSLGEWLPIYDQPDDHIAHMRSVLNLVCSCPARQGVIHTISTS